MAESTKRIDYSVKVKENTITFKRKSRMEMPIDFRVFANNGDTYDYHIPNNWFIKETDATILPKWHGWDLIHPEYSVIIDIPSGIDYVMIDPTSRLADAYMPDNNSKCNSTFTFDHKLWEYPDWRNYQVKYHPDIWWNNYDGVKLGLNLNGGYLNHHHLFDATVWLNTGSLQRQCANSNDYDYYSYRLHYNTNLDNIMLNSRVKVNSQFLAGLYKNKLSIEKSDSKEHNKISISLLSLYRTNNNYLLNREWALNRMNNRIDINLEHNYKYVNGSGKINLEIKSSTIGSYYNYNTVSLSAKNKNKLENLKINTRLFFQIGTGNNWAEESKLMLAGGSTEEMMNSRFTQTDGFVPSDYMQYDYTTNHFHAGGGLNLEEGYTGYLAPEFNTDGSIKSYDYSGTSGMAFNTEIDFFLFTLFNKKK